MNRKPIDAQPLTSIEEDRIRQSVHRHAFGWQQTSRLLATLDAAVSARQEAERVLEEVIEALQTLDLWGHPYLTGPSDDRCLNCGEIGSYGHSEPPIITDLLREAREARARTREPAGEGT